MLRLGWKEGEKKKWIDGLDFRNKALDSIQ